MHVLLVEAEASTIHSLHHFLEQTGYWVDSAPTYAAARLRLADYPYDFVVLDQELPDGKALDLLRNRAVPPSNAPSYIVLTATAAVEERLRIFDLGADDCLTKPVASAELVRRMQAIGRRRQGLMSAEICFGSGFVLNSAARTLRYGPHRVPISRKQFDLLHYLLCNRGQALSRQQLSTCLGDEQPATKQSSNYIDVHVKNVRKALASFASTDFLETVHGIGYRLVA